MRANTLKISTQSGVDIKYITIPRVIMKLGDVLLKICPRIVNDLRTYIKRGIEWYLKNDGSRQSFGKRVSKSQRLKLESWNLELIKNTECQNLVLINLNLRKKQRKMAQNRNRAGNMWLG